MGAVPQSHTLTTGKTPQLSVELRTRIKFYFPHPLNAKKNIDEKIMILFLPADKTRFSGWKNL
jgi:hypothetical protein